MPPDLKSSMGCEVVHLADAATRQITTLVLEALGEHAVLVDSPSGTAAALVLVVECEQDGGLGGAARKLLRSLSKGDDDRFSGRTPSVGLLAIGKSVCANSSAMLGRDKWSGAAKLQSALHSAGCTPLVAMGGVEIELEDIEASVLPWARTVREALDAACQCQNPEDEGEAAGAAPPLEPSFHHGQQQILAVTLLVGGLLALGLWRRRK